MNQTLSMCDLSCQALNIDHIALPKHDEKNLKANSPPFVSAAVNHFPPVRSSAGRTVPCQGCNSAGMKMQGESSKRGKSPIFPCASHFVTPAAQLVV